jgi:glycosyltransferase involved in cell wall biosynthesis
MFRTRFEESVGMSPVYLDYGELRKLPPLGFIRKIRSLGATTLLLPIEDELSRCILPLLRGIAAIADAESVSIIHPDLRAEKVRRSSAIGAIAGLTRASVTAARDMAYCARELTALNGAPRVAKPATNASTALYINANLWFGMKAGGSIGHVTGVANAFGEAGWKVLLASPTSPTMLTSQVEALSLRIPEVFGLPFEKSFYTFHRSVVAQLDRRLTIPPAFIYQRMSPANYSGVVLSRQWGVPLVLEYNGSEVWVGKNWGRGFRYPQVAAAAEDACLRHADVVVTVSEVLADELVDRGVSKDRIVWYPNCVDPAVFEPARFSSDAGLALRRRLGIAADAVVVMFIGTFGAWHGVEVFAQAIRAMAERDADALRAGKVHFVLVGDGLKMPAVRAALPPSFDHSLVTMTGLVPQEDAPQYLAIADVVVSPHVQNADGSRFFGSPTKLFEYMVMGKAIVASDLEQIGTILKAGIHVANLPDADPRPGEDRLAVLCPPANVDALVEALWFIVRQPAWRRVLGGNARAEALTKYTWARHVSAILDGLAAVSNTGVSL